MVKSLSRGSFVVVVGCLLLARAVSAAETPSRHLVTVQWLDQHRQDADLVILDASPAQMHAAGHIPGAIPVDAMAYGGKEAPIADTERLIQSWGIGLRSRIVMYDQGGSFLATRLFFSLLYHGVPPASLLVLDGGLARWQASGLALTKDPTPPAKTGTFKVGSVKEEHRVRLPEFLTGSGDPANHVLLEALDATWHFGQVRPFGKGGHPPFGVLWPSADLYNEDKTFKSPDDLRKMLAYLNVRPDQQIYTYCGGGVAASAPFFALKFILGYPNVKLYAESELGWISDPRGLPYWTYSAPYLLRDSAWLQWAGGQMVRTYLGSSVSIIDVRQPDAFAQGHVPFALNIPAGTFKAHAANPAGLATALGAAGVNPSHEAVIVSGAGLTPDAALVFAMLEALGQKQVSVLADSMDAWTRSGYSIAKTPTAVGPRKGPGDLSIEPVAYAARPRTGVAIADARQTTGIYPKVFVASGAALPSRPPDGTVVHVPYTALLDADGTPKPAADIWNTLKKAGVPRYAELVCVSDDAGEAAVNYVVFKLMGYPDVKVQTGAAR